MRKRRFSLFQKGFLLVAAPLIFEIVFVITLFLMVVQAQQQALQRAHILSNFQEISQAASEGYLAVFAAISYATLPTKQSYEDYLRGRTNYIRRVAAAQHIQSHPLTVKSVQVLNESSKKAIAILDDIDFRVRHNNLGIYEGFQYSRRAMAMAQELRANLTSIRTEYQAQLVASDEEAARFRQSLQVYIFIGITISLVIAIGLCFYFSKSIVQRLKVVRDNTMRTAAEAPLNDKVGGNDEIAELDKSIHGMAAIIAETRRNERAVIENASDIICTIDSNGRFASINPAALSIWGFSPDALIGRRCVEILADGSTNSLPANKEEFIEQKSEIFENRISTKCGAIKDMLWSVQKSNDKASLFCVVHDITERKEAERFKQQLTAVVSHDLRTPLTSMQGALTLLNMGALGELPEAAARKINILDSEIVRLITITNDLLEMESLTSGKLELHIRETDLDELLQRSRDSLETFAEQHGVTVLTKPANLVIMTDADRLSRVLINLIGNAIKFSPSGESVVIEATEHGKEFEVTVTDRGRGIPAGYHDLIFERFKQVEESDSKKKGGSGLGLAICKSIIEQLGGTIGVTSQSGEGSKFWFRLPFASDI